ncbi:MAG: transposase [Parcubacteria group bacterium]
MVTRQTKFALDEYYHLYSRGVDKRPIFLDQKDRNRFIKLLFVCNGSKPIVYREIKSLPLSLIETGPKLTAIGAYCLMLNHFHILVRETNEDGVTKFMSKLLTAYSAYFNKKYNRTGALFESTFKSEHLNTDEYLKYIFSYIHLNPLKIMSPNWRESNLERLQVERFLESYKESSYLDYSSKEGREESQILNKLAFPEYFVDEKAFKNNLFDWFEPPFDQTPTKGYPR